jgi:hypothetical protein
MNAKVLKVEIPFSLNNVSRLTHKTGLKTMKGHCRYYNEALPWKDSVMIV